MNLQEIVEFKSLIENNIEYLRERISYIDYLHKGIEELVKMNPGRMMIDSWTKGVEEEIAEVKNTLFAKTME